MCKIKAQIKIIQYLCHVIKTNEWYKTWFDSPYYHILYGHRDVEEARDFIAQLMSVFDLSPNAHILDLACGKGRHSKTLNDLGYVVTGIDLSENSIEHARQFENDQLSFEVGDMRNVFQSNTYTMVVNLFTSFGYFDNHNDHLNVVKAVHTQLVADGYFVIDYLNTSKAANRIGTGISDQINREGIVFNIKKFTDKNFINKEISFEVNEQPFQFTEQVWRWSENDLYKLLSENGFSIQTIYGDYQLNKFDPIESERLIMIAKKK
ncbi:MAG: 2-polyprenyl-3-methyl-5-hydroxy-6-metoxy-1,4-benzoquinol methylase [Bacteroidia bacterium]